MNARVIVSLIVMLTYNFCIAQQFKTVLEVGREYTLKLLNIDADIDVTIHNIDEIHIECTSLPTVPEKATGLRPLMTKSGVDNTGISLNMKITETVITLSGGHYTENQTYHLKMPQDVNLYIKSKNYDKNFDVNVEGLISGISVSLQEGDIDLINVRGPVNVKTNKGDITVFFTELNKDAPLDIFCQQGDIDVSLSKNESISFKLRALSGGIFTDLLIEEEETEDTLFYEGLEIGSKNGRDMWTYKLDPEKPVEMLSYDGIESITVNKDSGRIAITNKKSNEAMEDKIYYFDLKNINDTSNIYFHYDKVLSLQRTADEWNFIIAQLSYDFKGNLNGGGVEFSIKTGGGNIYLRGIE